MSLTTRALTIASLGSAVVAGSLLHPVVSGQVTHTTHMGGPIGEGLLPSAGAFVVLSLLLGLVAYHEHIPSVNQLISSRTTKRVAAVVVVGMVVSTAALSGPAVQPAQAAYGFQDCDISDSLTSAAIQSFTNPGAEGECRFNPTDDYSNISQTDAYATGLGMADAEASYIDTRDNFNDQVRGIMWMKAKIEIVESLNANESNATAKANAKAVVDNYTSGLVHNQLQTASNAYAQSAYLASQTGGSNTTGSDTMVFSSGSDVSVYGDTFDVTVQLPDGENRTYQAVYAYNPVGDGYVPAFPVEDAQHANISVVNISGEYSPLYGQVNSDRRVLINDPSSSDQATVVDTRAHNQRIDDMMAARSNVNSNIDAYADEVFAAYQAGELSTTDLLDPTTLASQASTSYNSTGYYSFASAELAAIGLTGDTNASHVVQTTWNRSYRNETGALVWDNRTVNVTGTMFLTGSNMSLETGTEYDPDNINGAEYIAVSSVENETGTTLNYSEPYFEVTDNFTIVEATNTKTGETVNVTTAQEQNFSSTNASQLADELDRLQELRAYYEEQQANNGGGISFDFGGVETGVIIALLAVAFLATRD